MSDRIEKAIELDAPVDEVWDALTDSEKFGNWFGVEINSPFILGRKIKGTITHPDYKHISWEVTVKKIDPEHCFAFSWHPYAIDANIDYSQEEPTLVEFILASTQKGTLLTIIETGFKNIPLSRQDNALQMHKKGWELQLQNIEEYFINKYKK